MTEYIIGMRNITKNFPGIVADGDVSIAVKPGGIYAMLGENGAGKSALMSILFGIGMMHQHIKSVHNYTIAGNIVMGRWWAGKRCSKCRSPLL